MEATEERASGRERAVVWNRQGIREVILWGEIVRVMA